jgi:uncharacterized protein (TIGR02246 family)
MDKTDDGAIRTVVEQWQQAWNHGDMAVAAALFCEDADFVNVRGCHWHGRQQIEREHVQRHRLQLKESIFSADDVSVQHLGAGTALVHVGWTIRGDRDADGTPRQPRSGLLSWLMLRDADGCWQIRSAHNTNITAAP